MAKRSLNVLLIALGLLFAQVPTQLHLLLVRHTTCEHGELVELPPYVAPPPDRPGEGSGAASGDDRSKGPQIAVSRSGAGHDHCDALAIRHRISEVGISVAAASLLSIEPPVERGEGRETRPVPLLSLAPKNSPPAA